MEVNITMSQKEKEEFVEILMSFEHWDAPNSSGYELLGFVENKSEYLDVVNELNEYYEDYRVKDALEKDFLKLVLDTKDERYIKEDGWEDYAITEFFENLEYRAGYRLRHQDENEVYVRTNN